MLRASSSAGVRRWLLAACASSLACHARTLPWFAFFPKVFQEKKDCSQPTHRHKALLISNAIENVHTSSFPDLLKCVFYLGTRLWHGMRGVTHKECVQHRKPVSSSRTSILLVPTIQPNSRLNLMLNFFILKCNPTRMLCNFGPKQPKLQNRPNFASRVGLLYNYLQHPNK